VADSLEQVASEVRICQKCQLANGRNNAVPGEGHPNAEIMFIGEGPGFHEDQSGRPFVGNAGQFLTEMLAGIGLKREDVFIANVVKCRPPGNRDPEPGEIDACKDYLDRQIELIDPKVIVTLGRYSMARWFPGARISKIHGSPKRVGERFIIPFYHPAAALHQASLRQTVEEDFKRLPDFVEQAKNWENGGSEETTTQNSDDTTGTQLSLF